MLMFEIKISPAATVPRGIFLFAICKISLNYKAVDDISRLKINRKCKNGKECKISALV